MAEGHREAAHSVLDGGEHNATLGASGIARLIGSGPLESGHAVLRLSARIAALMVTSPSFLAFAFVAANNAVPTPGSLRFIRAKVAMSAQASGRPAYLFRA
jgi:hypothetical protein